MEPIQISEFFSNCSRGINILQIKCLVVKKLIIVPSTIIQQQVSWKYLITTKEKEQKMFTKLRKFLQRKKLVIKYFYFEVEQVL